MEKIPENYYGFTQTATDAATGLTLENFFTLLGRFDLYSDRLLLEFPDYCTAECFGNVKKPLGIFTKNYQLAGNSFADLKANNEEVFAQIIETARTLCNAPNDAEFRYLRISPMDWTLKFAFYKNGQTYRLDRDGETYNNTIQENLSLVENAIPIAFGVAHTLEPEYWQTAVQY